MGREKSALYQNIHRRDKEERECYIDNGKIHGRTPRGNPA